VVSWYCHIDKRLQKILTSSAMKSNVQIIDPIVKKCDAIQAAGGRASDLARLLRLTRATVAGWKEDLPPLYTYRILRVFPKIEYVPPKNDD
jgi:hypothetical protein